MTKNRRVLVHEDRHALAGSVAARFLAKTVDVIHKRGAANVVLTGGTMGSAVLKAINVSPARDGIDWSTVQFWWGDERWVPREDPDRNERQAREALLNHIQIPAGNIHAMPASDDGIELDAAVVSYAEELASHAGPGASAPHLDITFLGVGPDGHIASLFPGLSGIRETHASVIAVRDSPKPPPERLSLTRPVLNSSDRIWLVLAGNDKAAALGLALAGANDDDVPAAGAKGRKRTVFFVDRAAAEQVPRALITRSY